MAFTEKQISDIFNNWVLAHPANQYRTPAITQATFISENTSDICQPFHTDDLPEHIHPWQEAPDTAHIGQTTDWIAYLHSCQQCDTQKLDFTLNENESHL